MAPWFFTITEQRDGRWAFRWGGVSVKALPSEDVAVGRLRRMATELGAVGLFDVRVIRRDGRIERRPLARS